MQALRAAMLASMTGLNFWALQYLQLAETGAIQFSVPVMIALISAWWLKERPDLRRWIAIVGGFAGVLLFTVIWFTFAYLPMAHMVWYWDGPDAIKDDATLKAVTLRSG